MPTDEQLARQLAERFAREHDGTTFAPVDIKRSQSSGLRRFQPKPPAKKTPATPPKPRTKERKKKKKAHEPPVGDVLDARTTLPPCLKYLSQCIRQMIQTEPPSDAGTRRKDFVWTENLAQAVKVFTELQRRRLCTVKEGPGVVFVRFHCLNAVLTAMEVTEDYMTRFATTPAQTYQRQPRVALLVIPGFELKVTVRQITDDVYLPFDDYVETGCVCPRPQCVFCKGRKITHTPEEPKALGRPMGSPFVHEELPAKRKRQRTGTSTTVEPAIELRKATVRLSCCNIG
jgi:hypothetical protein